MARLPIDLTQTLLVQGADLAYLSARPLPTAPDGHYRYEDLAAGESDGKADGHSRFYYLASDVQGIISRGPVVQDPKFIEGVLNAVHSPDAIDDRKNIFVDALAAITKLQPGDIQNKLNDKAITLLYETLPHPPATFIGDSFKFRAADGAGNNPLFPDLGRAGQPYARTVQGKHPIPDYSLPDAGLVFDVLLKARDFQAHPGKNSSLTFAFASLVTHSLFNTDPSDWTKNRTTSYLDLSPLYGYNQLLQDQVRDKSQGRGLLYPDTFSEDRLGFVPPAASALLVLFSRNHNYIANMLLQINEKGTWSNPPLDDAAKRAKQDEEIFQTARLVNCGHFMALIFGDYVAGFLGLGRDGCTWSMDPFDPIKTDAGIEVPRGTGNQCSVEFNVLYRWHATIAQQDIAWTESEFNGVFGGKALDTLTLQDFKQAAYKVFAAGEPDPKKRTFGGINRQADGTFSDDDLAKILQDATEKVAGAYRARGIPPALRVIEILGIQQARAWGVCTMNEFRQYLGLKKFNTFKEWNSQVPGVAEAAEQLYGHIDNLELYPGLLAEDCMALGPGSGICCGYTMTRAILADAIALVRGDRYFTVDYTPANLTAWGYADCVRNPQNGAFGAALPKLLFRHLPRHYPANSVYGLFPFFIPEVTKQNLTKLNMLQGYDFSRPKPTPVPTVLNTFTGIRQVFNDPDTFKQIYTSDLDMLTENYGFMLVYDERNKHDVDRKLVWHALFPDKKTVDGYVEWFKSETHKMIDAHKYKLDGAQGTYVDIIRNVVNLVATHWATDYLCGIDLKTKENPHGVVTEQEAYDMFSVLFLCVFENVLPENGWTLRTAAKQLGDLVNKLITLAINQAAPTHSGFVGGLIGIASDGARTVLGKKDSPATPFLQRLAALDRPVGDLVANVNSLAVGSSVNFAQALAQIVDLYLDDAYAKERAAIVALCQKPAGDAQSTALLKGYVREAMRLNPQFAGLFRTAAKDCVVKQGDGLPDINVKAGDVMFGSFKNAHLNPTDFPNPEQIDPTRPLANYNLQGAGFHGCPGVDFVAQAAPEIIRIIFGLKNLRRAPGAQGICKSFDLVQFGTANRLYVAPTGAMSPWPGSLIVAFDE